MQILRCESFLDGTLGIVEVAPNGNHLDILPLLGDHLLTLYGRYALVRVEHLNHRALHVGKAFEGSLPCVAGRGSQYQGLTILAPLLQRKGEQMGK